MVHNLVHNLCESLMKNIGGVADTGKKTPPIPITYLTQWKIVGNSEVHGNEIWSCGEYNATDGKYHILVQPLGGSIADIALDEPLRKVNDVADTIEFPSDTEGKALVTRCFDTRNLGELSWSTIGTNTTGVYRLNSVDLTGSVKQYTANQTANVLCALYTAVTANNTYAKITGISVAHSSGGSELLMVYDENYNQSDSAVAFKTAMDGVELIYELATPTTELIDAPQIEEADSYTCVISQGGKAVSWNSFETN